MAKKTLRFNIRMSEEQRAELEALCQRRGRTISFQIEHLLALGKLAMEFCDGHDDLKVVEERLAEAKAMLQQGSETPDKKTGDHSPHAPRPARSRRLPLGR